MPLQQSEFAPRRAGLWRPHNVGSTAGKQITFLPSKVATEILKLIDQYDRISSNIEKQWLDNFRPINTLEFHGKMSETRCAVYRLVLTFICSVPVIKEGKAFCPDT